MRPFLLSFLVVGLLFLFEKTAKKYRSYWDYFMILCIILGSIYTSKIMGDEVELPETYVLEYHEQFNRDCKFVPKGVPSNHVNEDGTPSDVAVRLIYKTNKKDAYAGLNHHADRFGNFEDQLYDKCWYCPNVSYCEKAKIAFSTAMAACPGDMWTKFVAVFITLSTQLGLQYIQEWSDIVYLTNMMNWHGWVAQHYANHINSNNW